MEEKKKVKSITAGEVTEKEKKTSVKVKDTDDYVYDERYEFRRKLRNIAIFLFGIIIVIGLLSLVKGGSGSDLSAGIKRINGASVYIENYNGSELVTNGSGFVYKKSKSNAYILTSYRVISGSDFIRVTFSNDTKADAKYVGGDQYSDIAVLSVPTAKAKKVAKIGSAKKMSLGSTVFTIGSPAGENYRGTVTRGILSGKDRFVKTSTESDSRTIKLLQTDARVDYGNDGGPLCNSKGAVIGMISSNVVKDDINGTSFAISIEDIMRKVKSFEKGNTTQKPYIGITMVNLSDTSSLDYYGLSKKINTKLSKGVVVESVVSGSAASGKLMVGDIITKINDNSVDNMAYLRYELSNQSVGDKATLTVERNGKIRDITIKLGSKSNN